MCGICGMFDMSGGKRIDKSILENMTGKLLHRGPDASGYYVNDNIALGFARLSIIDLETGMQPIFNEDETMLVLCNGEIYNYRELRKELVEKGHKFRTNCDVEVIVHLYEEYGADFVNELNGQFGFVVYDIRQNRLLCARDHVGIAPFFYTVVDNLFIFASEMKAILEHPCVKREVDMVAMDQILTFPGVVSPRTLIKNISSLENGHYMVVQDSNLRNVEYWDLVYYKNGELEYEKNESYYIEKLDELLTQAVRYRLHADVPVGFYISGGLDSSVIASKISQIDNSSNRHSFSIDFTDRTISEAKYQRMMAQYVNSIHHETMFGFDDIAKRLKDAVYYSEAALKETYNTASLALSESVRKKDIKVVLTGEGADELFGGYVGYKFDRIRQSQPKKTDAETLLENKLREKLWGDEDFIYEKNHHSYTETKRGLYSRTVNEVYQDIDCVNYPLINKSRIENIDTLHKRSYLDFKLRLSDHLLSDHGDRMAYGNSVEARYPYLDKNIMEFARLVPPNLKLKEFNEKYILKKLAEKIVPSEIIKRPKFAFVAPGSPELLQSNVEYINDILSYDLIKRQGFFNPDEIEKLRSRYSQKGFKLNLPFESDLLIMVITFGIFLDKFKMSDYC